MAFLPACFAKVARSALHELDVQGGGDGEAVFLKKASVASSRAGRMSFVRGFELNWEARLRMRSSGNDGTGIPCADILYIH